MSFGWSFGDLVTAGALLMRVRDALCDIGGASSQYRDEICFLQGMFATIGHLEALQSAPIDDTVLLVLQGHCKQVMEPVISFLEHNQPRFLEQLGPKTSWADPRSVKSKIHWALRTSVEIKKLRQKIQGHLDAILITLSHQTL